MIEFFIPWGAKPKQSMRMGSGRSYTPAKVTSNADALALLAVQHAPPQPLEGPLWIVLGFRFTWRSGEPKKNRTRPKPKDTRPDCDNLCKQVLDVLQSTGFFRDDAQAADVHITKMWDDRPGVLVAVGEIADICEWGE